MLINIPAGMLVLR